MSEFFAYIQTGETRYREVFGLDFEDFKSGQVFLHRPGYTVSQQDNKDEATETINNAMVHYDANYAGKTEWKQCLGVSTLTLQKVLGSTWKTFYKRSRIKIYHDIAMTHPVFDGDTLYARSNILNIKENADPNLGDVEVMTEAINQKNITVSKIHYTISIYKRGKHPEDAIRPVTFTATEHPKFLAYHSKDHAFLEQSGLYYEDFEVGEIYEHRPGKTFFDAEIWLHAMHSLEWHPCQTDANYIDQFHGGKRPVTDSYLLGAVSALTTRTFGRVVANLGWINTEVVQSVSAGDTLYAESKIMEKRESHSRPTQGILTAQTTVFNQHNQKVLTFQRSFLVYKKGLGPYEAAGY